jgi:carboxymethylenebutenolidase
MITETITLTNAESPMDAFLARPEGDGPFPAVIVVQEAFGVNDHIRDVCRRFASEGYFALAPELFHRAGCGIVLPYDRFEAVRPYLSALSNESIEQDLSVSLDHVRGRADVDTRRVGLVGFCIGGFVTFLGGCRLDPGAVVSFYGGGIVRPRAEGAIKPLIGETEKIRAPILCMFGAEDRGIPPEDVDTIEARLDRLKTPHEIVVYPGAGHGFFCDQRATYHAESARDAWRRTLDWFGRYLPAAAPPNMHRTREGGGTRR